jgi:hypothetical protein
MAADEASYNCVTEMEDADGHRGVKLSKDLMKIAGGCFGGSCLHHRQLLITASSCPVEGNIPGKAPCQSMHGKGQGAEKS